jgi:hypothetical protein
MQSILLGQLGTDVCARAIESLFLKMEGERTSKRVCQVYQKMDSGSLALNRPIIFGDISVNNLVPPRASPVQ